MVKGHLFRAAGLFFGGLLSFTACKQSGDKQEGGDKTDPNPSPPLATQQQALTQTPALSIFALLAERSIALRENSTVLGGAVGARATGTAGTLVSGATLQADQNAQVDASRSTFGAWLTLQQHAQVGPIFTDHLSAQAQANYGAQSIFVRPPVLPPLQPVAPGSLVVTVSKNSTATRMAGAYGAVEVTQGATLKLSGGLYEMASLTVRQNGRIEALTPVQLRVAGRVVVQQNASLVPLGAGASATSFQVQSSYASASATSTASIELQQNAKLRGLFLAPNGTISVQQNAVVTGALAARDIEVLQNATINYQDGFSGGSPVCAGGCDDGNPCTVDACNSGVCAYTSLPSGSSCSDGNACNGAETCNGAGACVAGVAPAVDDSNPCTTDACNPVAGVTHVPVAAGTSCSDGDACNGAELCNAGGVCQAGTPVVVDDGNPCTTDSCNPATGVAHVPVSAGTPCTDGNACNGLEACDAAGQCSAGIAPVLDDSNPCTIDSCSPTLGVLHVPATAGTSCSDGNACNGLETCNASGACVAGAMPVVDDGNPCTSDACNPATGITHAPVATGTSCSDGNACNGAELCNAAGSCLAGAAPSLDDHNPCTADSCNPVTGVAHVPVATGTSCSDGNACNGAETCNAAGQCVAGVSPSLDDGNPCTADSCNPATGVVHLPLAAGTSCSGGNACSGATCDSSGTCQSGQALPVDDHNPCTIDSCDPVLGVRHLPAAAGTSCSDGNACNGLEACDAAGSCLAGAAPALDDGNPCTVDSCAPQTGVTHVPVTAGTSCSDGNACNGAETCNATGACVAGAAPSLDDGNPCTVDSCDLVTGVAHVPSPGASCSDGNACNGAETCDTAGACQPGVPVATDDGNPCTLDSCNPSTGVVQHFPASFGTSCSDGNACNGLETCDFSGVCRPGFAPPVDDHNPCTSDSCNPSTGQIVHAPVPQGTSCSDGNACNGTETCDAVGACAQGASPSLDDGNPCTLDACDPVLGVTHAPSPGASCSDGNACNGLETCDATGACRAGVLPGFDDGNPCTVDGCHPLTGVFHTPVNPGTSCSDGDVCNGVETCDAQGACSAGVAPLVDDGDPCTTDLCDPSFGVLHPPAPAGTSCANFDPCDGEETCNGNGSCLPGRPPSVDDGNPCTQDYCVFPQGILHTPWGAGTSCSDNNPCNGFELCDGQGACLPGVPPASADDGNPCTDDLCDPQTGNTTHLPSAAGVSCSDGSLCNGAETCDGQGACRPGVPLVVRDADLCTLDACDPVQGVTHTLLADCVSPPLAGSALAPPNDPTVATNLAQSVAFLYTGSPRTQIGLAPTTIDPVRIGVIRGLVKDGSGTPLPGALVYAHGRPELGETATRPDGSFDFVVNAGGLLTLTMTKPGFLTAQRQVKTSWQRFVQAPEVWLVPQDTVATPITFGAGSFQVAAGSPVTDADGTRQLSLLVPPGTGATMHFASGATAPLPSGTLRLTEYTVGARGQLRMPFDLPCTSAYTYASELAFDEATQAGATSVSFDQPVIGYVENFLGLTVGSVVPVGSYTREDALWKGVPNGKVLKVVSLQAGVAGLDTDGDDQADDEATLSAQGITLAERQQLAQRYAVGASLIRSPLSHFSSVDLNAINGGCQGQCSGPSGNPGPGGGNGGDPSGGDSASSPGGGSGSGSGSGEEPSPCKENGSLLFCENQSLGESVSLAGTPFRLVYNSARTRGRAGFRTLDIPLVGANVPAGLQEVKLAVDVVGKHFETSFAPAANLSTTYAWDGMDTRCAGSHGVFDAKKWLQERKTTPRVGQAYPEQPLLLG